MYQLFFDFSFDPNFQRLLPIPYIAQQRNNHWYSLRKATDEVLKSTPIPLNPYKEEALLIANSLQLPSLLEKFTKREISIQKLYNDNDKKKYIQQQIEEKISKLLEIIATNQLLLTVSLNKEQPLENQYIENTTKVLIPSLEFEKVPDGIIYRLSLYDNQDKLCPSEHKITLLSYEKSWIVIDKKLVSIKDIKALNLKPFLEKTTVTIPEKIIPEYFNKFLKEIIKKVEINTIGFDIIQKNSIKSVTIKFVHDFLTQHYKFFLSFDYDGYIFGSNQNKGYHSNLNIASNGTITIDNYKRNLSEEAQKHHILEAIGFINEGGIFFVDDNDPFASYFHLLKHKEELIAADFFIEPIEIHGRRVSLQLPKIHSKEATNKKDWFDIELWIEQGNEIFSFANLIQNIQENNPIYTLANGTLFIIPKEWFAKYEKLAKFGKVNNGKIQLPKNNYALLKNLPEIKPKYISPDITYSPSSNLKATLRPYQKDGVKWLLEHYYSGMGACLADDMGLGKTLQILALLVAIHDTFSEKEIEQPSNLFELGQKQKEPLRALIILPSTLLFNWYEEVKRFTPQFKCTQYVGEERKTKIRRLINYDIIFTTYPIITRDAKLLEGYLFRIIILDESQRIKNKNSQVFKSINLLKADHRFSLSGTPIENTLTDLWSQMQFINPNILGSFTKFNNYFRIGIEKKHDPIIMEELKTIISPFLLRRTKAQVLQDLPDMEEQIVYCPMSEEQKKWYEREKSKVRNKLLHIDNHSQTLNILNMLTLLRQISNHPKLLDKQSSIPSGKYEEVINLLEQLLLSQHKALIFSSFISHLEIYEDWCKANNIKFATLTGDTPIPERKIQVESFQKDKDIMFFFISLKAGEVGLNLTTASYVLLLDPWWNPFAERQAIARAHRLGQQHKVTVIRFVTQDTLEEKIIHLQQNKKELSENIIEENVLVKEVLENVTTLLK
ncbi:DEAD/DEAH box helicase [Capnocytophaga sp. G2]|jgi:Superfamily II DNA/RNA helicases, SNF2 family|uniref:DEAD/DEAH box helicase n=1 Tax=Capnocytophaga sp. G2 TaxID=3110695 RepID=UPI002B4AA2E5|nr:SNF2-related protein [Capnocytophaga sp. G2]MEB3003800.1 SNF2-related protein [Capnocytophaga sp. G2]